MSGTEYDHGSPNLDPEFNARDPAVNPDILSAIRTLNVAIAATGEDIEGNVCYWNDTPAAIYRDAAPTTDAEHVAKRINLFVMARRHRRMVEIGLNGGHSAIICLLANPELHFYSIDICHHLYTPIAAEFLKKMFGRRFHFWKGDSRVVLPRLAIKHPNLKFDLIHIDGGHGAELAFCDLSNALRMAGQDADVVFDDVNAPHLGEVVEKFITLGYLAPSRQRGGLEKSELHEILSAEAKSA